MVRRPPRVSGKGQEIRRNLQHLYKKEGGELAKRSVTWISREIHFSETCIKKRRIKHDEEKFA